jgi:hypothetical protein
MINLNVHNKDLTSYQNSNHIKYNIRVKKKLKLNDRLHQNNFLSNS